MKKWIVMAMTVLLLLQMSFGLTVSAEFEPSDDPLETDSTTTTVEETEETTTTEGTVSDPTGDEQPRLLILDDNGNIVASLTGRDGERLQGVTVTLQIGGVTVTSMQTDERGEANFRYPFPDDDRYVRCISERTLVGEIWYAAASAAFVKTQSTDQTDATTTTIAGGQTTTTAMSGTTQYTYPLLTTDPDATKETYLNYTAAGTTALRDGYVAIDTAFDGGLLQSFGVDEHRFSSVSALLMPQANYAQLMNNKNGFLFLNTAFSTLKITDEHIVAAVRDDPVLSRADIGKVQRVVMDMSVQMQDAAGEVTTVWDLPAGDYVIQMPLPQSMQSATNVVVYMVTVEGIAQPVDAVLPGDGSMRFETASPMGTIAILGFETAAFGQLTSDSLVLSIILLVFGILCLGGAFCLFFFFVYRPKRAKKLRAQQEKAQTAVAEEVVCEQPEEFFEASLFDDEEPAPLPEKNNDIDIPL